MEHQQQTAADHVAQGAVGLLPLPGFAQFRRQLAPAQARMLRDKLADEGRYLRAVTLGPGIATPSAIADQCDRVKTGTQVGFAA